MRSTWRTWLWAIVGLTGTVVGWPGDATAEERCAVLELFVKGDSELSSAARAHVEKTYGSRRGISLVVRDVVARESDLTRLWKIADSTKTANPGLPAIYVSGRFECGWDAKTSPAKLDELLTVEVFVRAGCPRCAQAKPVIFQQIAPQYPGYRFVEKEIIGTPANNQRLHELARRYRQAATSVPALHYCGRLMIGFYDARTSYKQWDDVLRAVTVACPAETPTAQEPQSRRSSGVPIRLVSWTDATVAATETTPDEPPPFEAPPVRRPIPPEVGEVNPESEAPPPRPGRSVPPEIPGESTPDAAPDVPAPSVPDVVQVPLLGEVNWRAWGLPAFTILIGLIDGFNPCAMWVLLFLLSLLVNLRDRWKILAVAGTFVFISGAAYFAFMAAWLTIYQFVGLLRPVQIALGVLGITVGLIHIKDFFAFKRGVSLSIPESAKPQLYERMRKIVMAETLWGAIIGASTLAVLVNIVELLCTAGLPAMYTAILSAQNQPAWLHYLYLLLYVLAYMFDDSLMVAIVVITLGKHRLQETGGRVLKLISGLVILAIGTVMLLKPEWLV